MGELTKDDRNEYKAIVKYIKSNLETCFEVAVRLQRLKEGKLYLADYDTFEACVQSEFGLGKAYAYRLIKSAEIVENIEKNSKPVSPRGDKIDPPTQEYQTRPLAEVPPEKQPEAWEKAVAKADGKQPTAAQVKEAVKEVIDVAPPARKDLVGNDLPGSLWVTFESHPLFDECKRSIDQAIRDLKKVMEHVGGEKGRHNFEQKTMRLLKDARKDVEWYRPYSVCMRCKGKGCEYCHELGWLIKTAHEHLEKSSA